MSAEFDIVTYPLPFLPLLYICPETPVEIKRYNFLGTKGEGETLAYRFSTPNVPIGEGEIIDINYRYLEVGGGIWAGNLLYIDEL